MNTALASILSLAGLTLRSPRQGAKAILAIDAPRNALWQMLGLVVIASLLLTYLTNALAPLPEGQDMPVMQTGPIVLALIVGALTVAMVFIVYRVGRAMGGSGDLDGALKITIWLQILMLMFQAVQVVALVLSPPFAELLGIVAVIASTWLLTNFVAALHGFKSLLPVFLVIIVMAFVLAFAMFVVLALIGVGLPAGVSDV